MSRRYQTRVDAGRDESWPSRSPSERIRSERCHILDICVVCSLSGLRRPDATCARGWRCEPPSVQHVDPVSFRALAALVDRRETSLSRSESMRVWRSNILERSAPYYHNSSAFHMCRITVVWRSKSRESMGRFRMIMPSCSRPVERCLQHIDHCAGIRRAPRIDSCDDRQLAY